MKIEGTRSLIRASFAFGFKLFGYRLTELNSPEGRAQFSEHGLNGATANGFCLLRATELFKVASKVLEDPKNERRRIAIRESILQMLGVWEFSDHTGA